ncbi:MAG: hypothetical protein PHP23_04975 [Desulfobacterales bacterium]|nr:hypothetical protein [Desulfobacterales bacterium]MDD4072766.1 hypothetical protein [Desulfobacterales bacterium]MDD4391370.1 hypothetical protein [Desulfobacterales bacterium]
MKRFSWPGHFFCLMFLLLLPAAWCNAEPEPYDLVEHFKTGAVNWSRGLITATGTGSPLRSSLEKPDARQLAIRSAKQKAIQNLLETAKNVRIKSDMRVGAFDEDHDRIMAKLENMVREAQIVNRGYLSDGTVEVTVQLSIIGGFAQLLLPRDIRQIEPVRPVGPAAAPPVPVFLTEQTSAPQGESKRFTGIIVDARGLDVLPSMAPHIVDESGQEVYGAAYASREYAVQYGMSGYFKDIDSAQKSSRIADTPLIVRGLNAGETGRSDIVISNSDASKIRSASESLSFLRKCRIIIVLDRLR